MYTFLEVKKPFFVCLIFLMSLPLAADFKVLTGLNISNYRVSDDMEWRPKLGFQGGIGIEFDLSFRTLLEFNILFQQKKYLNQSEDISGKYVLNALSVPILLRRTFFDHTSPYIVGGIEIGNMLSYSQKIEGEELPIDLSSTIKKRDLALVIGGGFEFELSEELFLFFEFRYQHGIKNLLIEPPDGDWRKSGSILFVFGVRS